jgi:hypothetical protein
VISKNVVDDLDAIYFFDKFNMTRANSTSHAKVPVLDLGFAKTKMKNQITASQQTQNPVVATQQNVSNYSSNMMNVKKVNVCVKC